MEDIPSTLILRFRDLVTAPDETIKSHIEILEKNGFVWWGWWNKAGEQVPADVLTALNELMSQSRDGLKLILFDTGAGKLYSAQCTEIKFSLDRQPISSPDKQATPDYYRERRYLAWFKFIKIDKALLEASALKKYSYVEIDSFFKTGESRFQLFRNKIVASTDELRDQDRSIWFVRPATISDLQHEIRLFDLMTTQPAHFPQEFRSSPRNRILWLSDLHFGKGHGFPPVRQGNKRPLWLALWEALNELRIANEIGAVIISGDISFAADPQGFEQAKAFLKELSSNLKLKNYDFVICPGNHDFGFSQDPLTPGSELEKVATPSAEAFSDFYRYLFYLEPNEDFSSGRRFLLANTYPVEIVALNSVQLQQTAGEFQGHGFVGTEQMQRVRDEYQWRAENRARPTRIAVLHHHILPVTYSEPTTADSRYSITLDAEAIVRWLLHNGIDLVLHGHMHQSHCVQLRRPIELTVKERQQPEDWPMATVFGLGSTGVQAAYLGELAANSFGILTFSGDEMNIDIYRVDPVVLTNANSLLFNVTLPLRRSA